MHARKDCVWCGLAGGSGVGEGGGGEWRGRRNKLLRFTALFFCVKNNVSHRLMHT